jgi:branched-chain amino acid transport system ATP-binding protein
MNVADDIVVLDAGAVIAKGHPSAIQNNQAVIEAYLGREANVTP